MLKGLFTDHPRSVGESYLQHLGMAASFGASMVAGGLACLLHGLFPFLFVTTGSRTVRRLYDRMVANRRRQPLPLPLQPARDQSYLGEAI